MIGEEINAGVIAISNEFKAPLSENSFRRINHIYSNLSALATVGIFDYVSPANNTQLMATVNKLKEKIVSKLTQIGEKGTDAGLGLPEFKRCMIHLQMARHILIDDKFHSIASYFMQKAMNLQLKIHGILKLSEFFEYCQSHDVNKYWCREIVFSFPMFSGTYPFVQYKTW